MAEITAFQNALSVQTVSVYTSWDLSLRMLVFFILFYFLDKIFNLTFDQNKSTQQWFEWMPTCDTFVPT